MPKEEEIYCSHDDGIRYREGVYVPLDVDSLPNAPDTPDYPKPGSGPPFHRVDSMPKVPRLRDVIGPSVIALGMGLGAGEFLLWPNLIAVNGFSIWWLFWIGVITQFLVIGEIERWTLATGESIFVGMKRLTRIPIWPWFFLVATIASFFWPGWASQSATFTGQIINGLAGREVVTDWQPLALLMMASIWIALALSRIVYNALEKFEILLVLTFFPLLVIALLAVGILPGDVIALAKGAVLIGRAPGELLSGEQFPTLLIAVAYAGTGGTLLLAQSLWIRDKGFGMGSHQGRIAGIRGENEPIQARGFAFSTTIGVALDRFRSWMRLSEKELFSTFVVLIILSVVVTTLLVGATIGTDRPDLAGDLNGMVQAQAAALKLAGGAWLELAFLTGGALVLFSTQLGIVDTVTRITGDIFHDLIGRSHRITIKTVFLAFLSLIVGASMLIIGISWMVGEGVRELQPNFLILIAGPFTIISMYCFSMVVAFLNTRYLPVEMRMPRWKLAGMYWAIVLWGWFSAETLSRVLLARVLGETGSVISSIEFHPVRMIIYGVWIASLIWLIAMTWKPGMVETGRAGNN